MIIRRLPGLASAIGLLVGLLFLFGTGLWFVSESISAARQQTEVRKATVAAMSLAAVVEGLQAAGSPPDAVAPAIDRWRQGDGRIQHVRLVRQSGAQLIYSDVPADQQIGATPRRLDRSEKPLFDLAAQLRANAENNRAEGIKRLEEIAVEALPGGLLRVSAPVQVGDAYWGVAQVERRWSDPAVSGNAGLALMLGVGALALFVAAALFGPRLMPPGFVEGPEGTQTRTGTVGAFTVGLLILLATAWIFGRAELETVAGAQSAQIQELQTVYAGLLESGRAALAALGLGMDSGVAWDVDRFLRPTAQITPDGVIDTVASNVAINDHLRTLQQQLWLTSAVAVGILAFFGLGTALALWRTLTEYRSAYFYVLPAILGMLFLVFFPFTYGVLLSFTDRTLFNQSVPLTELFVGFRNYIAILGDVDVLRWTPDGWTVNYESFYWTLFITICWTVTNVAIGVTIGLALALALNTEGLRGKMVYRVLLILPWAIPNYITALTWKGMFHQQFGVINQAIVMFGGEPIAWFDDVFSAFMTGVITNGWLSFPFMMVVSLGALASIPSDMYEAAKLDGASKWQQFWHITLPLLKPALIPAIILSVVWTFNMFNVIYLVSGGEPAGANEILITKAYKLAFERYQYAYAAAYSFVIFLILLAYGVFQNKVSKATEQVR